MKAAFVSFGTVERSVPLHLQQFASFVISANPDSSVAHAPATGTTFEPILPDTTTLVGFGVLVVLCVVAANVWSNEVVPVSRTKLALSKSQGEVKDYLEEIRDDEDRAVEQWLFTDWLQKASKKAPAIPVLKKAKWNSGDNPVVVTAAIMMVGILIASITERVIL